MTIQFYHIRACFVTCSLQGTALLQIFIEQAALNEALGAHEEHEAAVSVVGDFAKLINTDAGISSGFLKGQIALFPDRDFFHREPPGLRF